MPSVGRVQARQVSPVEITRLYLNRCAVYNTHLCCVVTLMESAAMEQARAAEAEIMAGHYRGPLHGIPWGIKDLFYTRAVPTTLGLEPLKERIVDRDATIVDRLRGAGAILIAKLAPTTGSGVWFGGTTRNPWDVAQGVADGSSAGSASATAAGLVAFSIGQENTGSIVWPSCIQCQVQEGSSGEGAPRGRKLRHLHRVRDGHRLRAPAREPFCPALHHLPDALREDLRRHAGLVPVALVLQALSTHLE